MLLHPFFEMLLSVAIIELLENSALRFIDHEADATLFPICKFTIFICGTVTIGFPWSKLFGNFILH